MATCQAIRATRPQSGRFPRVRGEFFPIDTLVPRAALLSRQYAAPQQSRSACGTEEKGWHRGASRSHWQKAPCEPRDGCCVARVGPCGHPRADGRGGAGRGAVPVSGGWRLNGTAVVNGTASPANLQLTPATTGRRARPSTPPSRAGGGHHGVLRRLPGVEQQQRAARDGLTFTLADASVTKPTALGSTAAGDGLLRDHGIAVPSTPGRTPTIRRTTSSASPRPTPPSSS